MKFYMITNHSASPEDRFRKLYMHPALAFAAFRHELVEHFGWEPQLINKYKDDELLEAVCQFGLNNDRDYDFEMIEFELA